MRCLNLRDLCRTAIALSLIGAALSPLAGTSTCLAEDAFGTAIPAASLATMRGGDNATTDSNNVILSSGSTQNTTATNQNNSITAGGDVVAGNVTVSNNAFTDMHGMTNVVVNTAPMANVQGIMSLNLTLQ